MRTFVAEGAAVVSLDVLDDAGQAGGRDATAAGPGTATYQHLDISRRSDVFAAVDEAAARLGGLDALCNIAGIEYNATLDDITEHEMVTSAMVPLGGSWANPWRTWPPSWCS